MDEQQEFGGTEEKLLEKLLGREVPLSDALKEDASLIALEFFKKYGANITPMERENEDLEVSLGGPVFFSVEKFVWDSASTIFTLAFALVTHDHLTVTSAIGLVKSAISNISVFRADTPEFKIYSAVAHLQKLNLEHRPTQAEIGRWLAANGHHID